MVGLIATGVDVSRVTECATPTGCASICTDRDGRNQIVVAPGANLEARADRDNPSTVSLTRFSGCTDDAEVLFFRVDGSAHSVPSTAPIGPEGWEASGRRNRDMETAQVLWRFFQAHRLASPSSGQ